MSSRFRDWTKWPDLQVECGCIGTNVCDSPVSVATCCNCVQTMISHLQDAREPLPRLKALY